MSPSSSKRRAYGLLAAFAFVALVVGIALLVRRGSKPPMPPPKPTATAAYRFHFRSGEARHYALRLQRKEQVDSSSKVSVGALGATVGIDGELVLRSYGAHNGATLVGVSLRSLSRREFSFAGQQVFSSTSAADAALQGREAYVDVGDRGEQGELRFRPADPPEFRAVMRSVVPAFAVTAPAELGVLWAAEEASPLGKARANYAADETNPLVWKRDRAAYVTFFALGTGGDKSEVQGAFQIAVTPEGALRSLDGKENVSAVARQQSLRAEWEVHMSLLSTETLAEVAPPPAEADQVLDEALRERRHNEELAAGLTLEAVETQLLGTVTNAHAPDGWMIRAVALLRLHPEFCPELVELFGRAQMTSLGRGLLLDLLVSAGTKEAQKALRDALSLPAAHAEPKEYPMFLQRCSMLNRPELETVAFVAKAMDDAKRGDDRTAAIYALGSTTGSLLQTKGDVARPFEEKLRQGLEKAREPEEKKAFLAALGNTGDPRNATALTRFARDPSPKVREQLAVALRKTPTPEAKQALFTLLRDKEVSVGRSSVHVLVSMPLTSEEYLDFAGAAKASNFPSALDGEVLSVIAAHDGDSATTRELLRTIEARAHDGKTVARAHAMLEQVK